LTHMTTAKAVDRARRRVLREYKRLGYRVIERPGPEAMPEFLREFRPGLLAERDDDHVVVEVRTARSLKGANEFVELASRIEGTAGWRLELVTVRPVDPPADAKHGWEHFREIAADELMAASGISPDFKAAYLVSLIDELVPELARRHGIRGSGGSLESLVHELAFQGLIDDDMVAAILAARDAHRSGVYDPGVLRLFLTDAALNDLIARCGTLFSLLMAADEGRVSGAAQTVS
jgi:hypothetical protein